MYELNRDVVIKNAIDQIGKPCGKTNEYSEELDSVKFYNFPKNGVADSCSIFVDDMIYRSIKPQTADNAREALYEPNIDNCGAGCTQASGYFKSNNAWYSKMSDFHKGDKIFFKKSNGAIYHTGLIVDWDNKGVYTVEGNVSSKVVDRFYYYGDSKVAGAGRPKYYQVETVNPGEVIENLCELCKGAELTVNTVNDDLMLRSGPGTQFPVICKLKKGTKIKWYGQREGNWIRVQYKSMIGYVHSAYVKI